MKIPCIKLVTLLLLLATVACKPKQKAPAALAEIPEKVEKKAEPKVDSSYAVTPKSVDEILAADAVSYRFFSASADLDYSDADQRFSGTMTIRMIPDSVAWFSIQKFGFEGMRGLITKDSIYLLNRLEQSYLTKAIDEVASFVGFPVKIRDLQQLILGNPLLPLAEKPCFTQDPSGYSILQKNQNSEEFALTWNFSTQKLSSLRYSNKVKKINFEAQQQDYQENIQLNNHKFSYLRTMKLLSPEKIFDLKLLFTEVKWNESKKLPFEIPSYYSKVTQF